MKTTAKISTITFIALAITISHYVVDPHAGSVHDILQRVYYVPIVLAGLWFGVRGGLITAFLVTLAYLPHARHGWYGPYTFVFQASEMTMYHVIGGLCGYLSNKEKKAFEAEHKAHEEKEVAYEAERKSREEKEAALQSLRDKTRELFKVEEEMRRADRLAALGSLSAGLAHEIRNPLGSIKTSAEMLADCGCESCTNPQEGDLNFVEIIQQEVDRLDHILSEFLRFARDSENEKLNDESEPAVCSPNEVLARTIDLLHPQLLRQVIGIDMGVKNDVRNKTVAMSTTHLQQVFLNLLLNAMEAIGIHGSIQIEMSAHEDILIVSIEDSGPGIPAELADRIFDPFFSSKEKGSGLGLSIVDRILTANGGSIILNREHQPLNRFEIKLPIINN